MEKTIDTSTERTAIAALNRPKTPDPALAEVAALRGDVVALIAAIVLLTAAMATTPKEPIA